MPKAIKLPSAATMRPLDLAGLNSLTQMGVVAVLKPLPHPLQDASCNRQTILISQYVHLYTNSPYDSADNHLRNTKSAGLQNCSDAHEESPHVKTLATPNLLADQEDIDSTCETADSANAIWQLGYDQRASYRDFQ